MGDLLERTNPCRRGPKRTISMTCEELGRYRVIISDKIIGPTIMFSLSLQWGFTLMNLATRSRGVYTIRAQGAIYYKIGSLLPNSNDRPRYLQLSVYDTDHKNEN
ncbi:hypothetical protein ACSBR2_026395 [Camellia fascicularis]